MDDYRLPAVYGKSRLVLLAVNPYLIHAYWEIAREDLGKAKELAADAQEVLRFYKRSELASEDAPSDCFDVEIDLQSRNWYVQLWSAEESYFADLGLKRKDGTLIRLVRSQVVHMPRPHPAIAIDQRFMKVDSTEQRAEIVQPPPIEHKRPQEAPAPRPSDFIDLSPISRPADSAEIVTEKIEPVYAFHHWPSDPSEPDTARAAKTFNVSTGSPNIDLTAMAERNLATGSSSVSLQKGRPDSAPDSKK